jgi:hypothetical protein
LPAEGGLRNVQFQCGAGDVLLFSGGNEIAQVSQFHRGSIRLSYAKARNMVFHRTSLAVAT